MHYQEPRIVVQQIFWNRLSASLEFPNEPQLYLNTLFSITRPKANLNLAGLLTLLNSRFMSAAYERWANRLFGDKFPKVSKLDLARLPIPTTSGIQARTLSEWGTRLQSGWTRLKELTVGFHDALALADASGRLSKELTRFWELPRPAVVKAIAESIPDEALEMREALLQRWAAAKTSVEQEWQNVSSVEAQAEELVLRLYGVKADVYLSVINRAPVPSLEDLLLPR